MKKDNVKNGRLKRGICFVLAVVMLAGMAFGMAGCGKDERFSLVMTVDKTSVRVGDTVTVTVIFKNMSGKDIPIELTDWQTVDNERHESKGIERVLYVDVVQGVWSHNDIGALRREGQILEKDAIIQSVKQCVVLNQGVNSAVAQVSFWMGNGYSEFVEINSKSIKIFVGG